MSGPFKSMTRRLSGLLSDKSTASSSSSSVALSSDLISSGGDSETTFNNRSYQLLDPQKLGIKDQDREAFQAVNVAVIHYMYGPAFDASHDYEHIQRVVALALQIYTEHEKDDWARGIDRTVLYVACLVHDVGDSKYHIRSEGDERDQEDVIRDFLKVNGCGPKIWGPSAYIAARVSFSRELKDPKQTKNDADNFPALRIVQDADRLDGLGAIGIGRCFVFGGINEERRKGSIQTGVELHYNRFERYLELMKTNKGIEMAKERLEFMASFRKQWFANTDCRAVL